MSNKRPGEHADIDMGGQNAKRLKFGDVSRLSPNGGVQNGSAFAPGGASSSSTAGLGAAASSSTALPRASYADLGSGPHQHRSDTSEFGGLGLYHTTSDGSLPWGAAGDGRGGPSSGAPSSYYSSINSQLAQLHFQRNAGRLLTGGPSAGVGLPRAAVPGMWMASSSSGQGLPVPGSRLTDHTSPSRHVLGGHSLCSSPANQSDNSDASMGRSPSPGMGRSSANQTSSFLPRPPSSGSGHQRQSFPAPGSAGGLVQFPQYSQRQSFPAPPSNNSSILAGGPPASAPPEPSGRTSFGCEDLVECGHAPAGSCLQCVTFRSEGVFQVPYAGYVEYLQYSQLLGALEKPSAAEYAEYATTGVGGGSLDGTTVTRRSLVNGEIHFPSFMTMCRLVLGLPPHADLTVDPRARGVGGRGLRFLDLGSGLGRATVAWASTFGGRFVLPLGGGSSGQSGGVVDQKVLAVGVEVRKSAHELAVAALQQCPELAKKVLLVRGDMFELEPVTMAEADVVMVSGTGMDALFSRLVAKLGRELRKGTKIISISQQFPRSGNFREVTASRLFRMSWRGNCRVYFHEKL